MPITLIFVEGHRDFYFFYHTLQTVKNFVQIEPNEVMDYIYYHFKRRDRLLIRHDDEIIIIIRCDGKINAIDTFLHAIPKLFQNDTSTTKILVIVDDDHDRETKEKIIAHVNALNQENSFDISNVTNLEHLVSLKASSEEKQIVFGIMNITPNLDHVLATLIKENNVIPRSQQDGDYDTVISKTMSSCNLNLEQLCKFVITQNDSNFENFLSRFSIKTSLCNFFN